MSYDPKQVEILKTWYSVFCTIMDEEATYTNIPYMNDEQKMFKLKELRELLKKAYPVIEEEMKRMKRTQ